MASNEVEIRVTADTKTVEKGLSRMNDRLQNFSKGATAAGRSITLLSAPIMALGVVGIKMFGEFEQNMAKAKAVSQSTGKEFAALETVAKEMGATTVFTARESARALTFMSMAGMSAQQSISALPSVLQLAAAGGLELASASDIVTNVMAGFGLGVDELAKANDVLVTGFTSANTDLEQLGQAFKFAGPVAKAAGLSFEETTAILSLLGNAGIQASMAGTSLRGAITKLLNPTEEAADLIEGMGLNILNSQGKMLPFTDIVDQLSKTGLSAADAMTIFGQRAGPAMLALVSQGSEALGDLTKTMMESGGTAKNIADTQLDTFSGSMTLLKSRIEAVGLSLGESLAPMLRSIVEDVGPMIEQFATFISANQTLAKVIFIAGGVLVAFGGTLMTLGLIIPMILGGIAALVGAFTALKVLLTGPLGLAAIALALGAGAAAVVGVKKLASFDTGGRVPEDMLAQIHKGEIIIPEDMARNMPSFQAGTGGYLQGVGGGVSGRSAEDLFAVFSPTGARERAEYLKWVKGMSGGVKITSGELKIMDGAMDALMNSTESSNDVLRQWLESIDYGVPRLKALDAVVEEAAHGQKELQRITEGAALALSDEFLDSLTAINSAGPSFNETLQHFSELGFNSAQAFDLASIKIGKDYNDSLLTVLGSMEGGESILEGMTEGLISQQDVLDILIEKYGGMEEAVKHFEKATKGATEELVTFNDLVLMGQFKTRVGRGGQPEMVTWGGAGGPQAMGVPSFMDDPKVVEQLLLSTAGMADPGERERRLRGYGVSNAMTEQFSDLIGRINLEEIFTRESALAFEKAYKLIISGADKNILTLSEQQTQDIDDLFEGNAKGGIVTRPTIALLGEAGPEAIVPLGRGGAGMAPTYNITISGNTVFGEMDFKRLVVKAVTDSHRRGGLPFLGKA